jgi:hypothetical protein
MPPIPPALLVTVTKVDDETDESPHGGAVQVHTILPGGGLAKGLCGGLCCSQVSPFEQSSTEVHSFANVQPWLQIELAGHS